MTQFVAFLRQTLSTLPILMLSFLYGCKVGYTQSATPIFESKNAPFEVTKNDISWMGSISYTGTLLSVIICFFFGNKMGRKVFIGGSILVYLLIWITFLVTSSSIIIIVGLGFYGISASMHAIMGFVYIGEVGSPQNREILGIAYGLAMLLGIGIEFLISTFENYRLLIIFPIVVNVFTGVLFLFMRESPYYLLSKGKRREALTVQAWLTDETEASVEAGDFNNMELYARAGDSRGQFVEMFKIDNLLILGLMVWLNGSNLVNSGNVAQQYGQRVMENFSSFMNLNYFVTIFNVVSFFGAIASFLTVKLAGRKVLLLVGYILVVLCQVVIGILYFIEKQNDNKLEEMAYIIGGLHCVTWFFVMASIGAGLSILKTEIFPGQLKEFYSALLAFTGDAIGFGTVKSYTPLVDSLGNEWVLALYAVINFICIILVLVAVRDTKDKTLYEIQSEMKTE